MCVQLGSAHSEGGNAHEAYMHYKKRVANCFYWEKKLQGIRDAMRENGITPPRTSLHPSASVLVPVPELLLLRSDVHMCLCVWC